MKIKIIPSILTAAILSFLLSFGGVSCLVTAFHLDISLPALALCCGLCALGGCAVFSFRKGGAVVLCGLALLGGYLWQKGQLADQTLQLCYNISYIYNLAYGCGWLGSPASADTVTLPLFVSGGLIALIAGWCITRRRFTALAVFFSLLPLALCVVVTNTVPAIGSLFLLLLGLILLLLTQSVRRRDGEQAVKLTWMLAAPVALALALLFLANPQAKYDKQDQAENIQDAVLQWVENIPYVDVAADGTLSLNLIRQVPDSVNLQSIGPNAQFGIRVMEVTAEVSGQLYLRGRDFDIYTGTAWKTSPGRSETFAAQKPAHGVIYYDLDLVSNGELSIRTFGRRSIQYLPYYPARGAGLIGGALNNTSDSTAYSYQWYALPADYQTLLEESWKNLADRFDSSDGFLYGSLLSSAYYPTSFNDTAAQYYLNLPTATANWAAGYLAEHLSLSPEDSICATANAIADLVRSSASYDLDTPRMPGSQTDFAKWFLEDSDTGYCVHYATATTVLLRAAGIAARYVEGYITNAVAGETVTITEKDAHAWVEYYITGIGWVPLESTGSAAEEDEVLPVFAPEEQTQASSEAATAPSTPQEATASTGSAGEPATSQPQSSVKPPIAVSRPLVIVLLLLIGLLGQYPIRLYLRQKYLQIGTTNVRALKKWRFACRLARLSHQPPPEDLEELALRAKFSQHTLTEADLANFDTFCGAAAAQLRQRPWWLRLYHRLFWAAY